GIKKAVVEVLKAGTRQDVVTITEALGDRFPDLDSKQVGAAIKGIQQKPPKGFALDARHVGRSHKYRLVSRKGPPSGPPVSPEARGGPGCGGLAPGGGGHRPRAPAGGRPGALARPGPPRESPAGPGAPAGPGRGRVTLSPDDGEWPPDPPDPPDPPGA